MITPILSAEDAFELYANCPISEASDSDAEKTEDAVISEASELTLDDTTRAKLISLGMVELVNQIHGVMNAVAANDWSKENL